MSSLVEWTNQTCELVQYIYMTMSQSMNIIPIPIISNELFCQTESDKSGIVVKWCDIDEPNINRQRTNPGYTYVWNRRERLEDARNDMKSLLTVLTAGCDSIINKKIFIKLSYINSFSTCKLYRIAFWEAIQTHLILSE